MTASPSRSSLLLAGVHRLAFVFVVAAIAAVGSERMFWFWSPGLTEHLAVSGFYAIAAAVVVWATARHRVNSWWSLMLALPLFSLVVEGVITPVVYSGGPLVPVFPAWFAFWHGALSVGLLVFGVRWMLLAGRNRLLAVTSGGLGLFWGVWSTTLWLPENREDPELIEMEGGPLHVLDTSEFALYAATFTAVVLVGHALLDRLWLSEFTPHRFTERVVGGLVLLGAALWTLVIPWAFPMFVAYAWIQRWGLRRHAATATGPTLLQRLDGRVALTSYVALLPMGVVAATTYAVAVAIEPPEALLRTTMWSIIAVQGLAGFALMAWSLRRAGRVVTVENDDTLEPVGPRVS